MPFVSHPGDAERTRSWRAPSKSFNWNAPSEPVRAIDPRASNGCIHTVDGCASISTAAPGGRCPPSAITRPLIRPPLVSAIVIATSSDPIVTLLMPTPAAPVAYTIHVPASAGGEILLPTDGIPSVRTHA